MAEETADKDDTCFSEMDNREVSVSAETREPKLKCLQARATARSESVCPEDPEKLGFGGTSYSKRPYKELG